MIYVDRSRVTMPKILSADGMGEAERRKAEEFYRTKKNDQRRFEFKSFRSQEVRQALKELFFNKCAYCESLLSVVDGDVEMFRPKAAVAENPLHPGYWWLTLNWNNLLIACPDCNRLRSHINGGDHKFLSGKANRFPLIDESARCFDQQDDLLKEQPLLLDPCNDDPDEHLVFDWSGLVASDTLRGQTTIAVLGLNRRSLLEARAREAELFRLLLDQATINVSHAQPSEQQQPSQLFTKELDALTKGSTPYAGMKRQLLRLARSNLHMTGTLYESLIRNQDKNTVSKARLKRAQRALRDFETAQSKFSLSNESGRKIARSQQRSIESISLRNFKGLRDIEITLKTETNGGSWLMLLGENSTGKSSILQAIALCLAGADYFADLVKNTRLTPNELVNSRARKARIAVKLTGFVAPHLMFITASGATFQSPSGEIAEIVYKNGQVVVSGDTEAREGQLVLLGYGATRLLPHRGLQQYGQDYARIDNLFDAFLPLCDADKWLSNLNTSTFNDVARTLKDLMALDDTARLHRKQSRVYVHNHGDNAPIQRLSDGFQSVIAMSVDILEVALRLWGKSETAEGIVLLDEIGAHLHPSWKMRIVTSLRRAFPGIQFISTTHDPLCLRGLTKGEVVVMRRDEQGNIEPIMDLPSPGDFRVDQLLTSEFFGLNSTVDPETEVLFDSYYALLALHRRTPMQDEELELLQQKLQDRRYVGDTLRDQLMFEAVDKIIAQHRVAGNFSMPAMRQEAVNELTEMWESTVADSEGKLT